jgi:hypothetical protein
MSHFRFFFTNFTFTTKPALLEQITNEEYINLFAKMLNKSNENDFNDKTNRLLQIIYESVVQETFDFVGVILLMEKVERF